MTWRSQKSRKGFTLVELTLAMAFLTVIALGATTTFVYILGIYNKAQGLTRTQQAARNSMDTVVRDLRLTESIDNSNRVVAGVTFAPGYTYCLKKTDGTATMYAMRLNAGKYRLVRYGSNCAPSATDPYEQLVEGDLWMDDSAQAAPANFSPFFIRRTGDTPTDPTRCSGGTNRCPSIDPVWTVGLTVYRGSRLPWVPNSGITDPFSASTALQTTVTTRN